MPKIVLLWTDVVLCVMFAVLIWVRAARVRANAKPARQLVEGAARPAAFSPASCWRCSLVICRRQPANFRPLPPLPEAPAGAKTFYATRTESVLDACDGAPDRDARDRLLRPARL